jgi:hypothetical protein
MNGSLPLAAASPQPTARLLNTPGLTRISRSMAGNWAGLDRSLLAVLAAKSFGILAGQHARVGHTQKMNEIQPRQAVPEAQAGSPDRAVFAGLGERYAYYRRCQHVRTNGEQCKAPAMKGEAICNRHAEQLESQRRRAEQRREFYARPGVGLGNPRAIQKTLNELAREIAAGRMDRKVISRVIADLQIIMRLEKALRRFAKTKRSAQAGLLAARNSFQPVPSASIRSAASSSAISALLAREAGPPIATRVPASSPLHPLPQRGDMSKMMVAVPGVERQDPIDVVLAGLGVDEAAREIPCFERAQQGDPARVHGVKQRERDLDGSQFGVFEPGPGVFVVGLDGGHVFREGPLGADVGVELAVGQVVNDLADGPATVAIRRVELFGGEAGDRLAHTQRQPRDLADVAGASLRGGTWVGGKASNRVAGVVRAGLQSRFSVGHKVSRWGEEPFL